MLTTDQLIAAWQSGGGHRSKMAEIRSYYDGKQSLPELMRARVDGRRKTVVRTNWTRYATTLHTGYLLGKPPSYVGGGDAPLQSLRDIYTSAKLHSADVEHLRNALLYGYSVEVHAYVGDDVRITTSRPWQWRLIEDDQSNVIAAIYRTELPAHSIYRGEYLDKPRILYYLYTDQEIVVYEETVKQDSQVADKGDTVSITNRGEATKVSIREVERVSHPYGRLPLVVFQANEDRTPFFSDAFRTQCDVYDISRSSLVDDVKHSVDAMLLLKGFKFEALMEKDKQGRSVLEKLREMGVLPAPTDAEASYLSRSVDVGKFQFDLTVTRAAIHIMAAIPDLDETINGNSGTITNVSGIALKLLFHAMDQASIEFERHFADGLRDRVELINIINRLRSRPTLDSFDINMTRNLPINDIELIQYMPSLDGVVSAKDKLRLMPQISDVERSYAELMAERQAALDTPPSDQE